MLLKTNNGPVARPVKQSVIANLEGRYRSSPQNGYGETQSETMGIPTGLYARTR
jgi:hypothetical protein